MPSRDYLMRLIEQAVQVILRIALLRETGHPDLALADVVDSVQRLFGLPMGEIATLDADHLFGQLTKEEGAESAREKCLVFAALANQAGLAYEAKDLPALAQPAFHLALAFTLRALAAQPGAKPPEIAPDIAVLEAKLAGFELPESTRQLLAERRAPAHRTKA